MSHFQPHTSRFSRVLSFVAATVIMGTLFASVAIGLTETDEQVAAVAPALA